MNIQDLFTALQPFQNKPAGTLTIPAANIMAWTDIHALIAGSLANQTLTISAIQAFPAAPTANAIVYQGQATLFPWTGSATQAVLTATATFTVDSAGSPQLLIRAEAPSSDDDWTLGASLDGLTGTDLADAPFEEGLFLLTSTATSVSGFPGTVKPFVDFQGRVVTDTGPFTVVRGLLPTPESRTVAGTVAINPQRMPDIALEPVGGAPITLAGILFEFGVTLSSGYLELPYYDETTGEETTVERPFSAAKLVATVAFGAGPALRLSLELLPQSEFYALSVSQTVKPLSSWADLEPLSSGLDLGTLIPSDVPSPVSMVLRNMGLTLRFAEGALLPTVQSVTFDVMMDVGDWALLPNDILTVQDVGLAATVAFPDGAPPYAFGSLYCDFTIVEEVAMTAALSIPRLVFTAGLQPGMTVSVESLMASVMEKLTGRSYRPPIEMEISRLEMSIDIRNRTFGFGSDILTDWSVSFGEANGAPLITLAFEGISFDVDYDGQLLQGSLTAFTAINEGHFAFTATSPGNGVGWGFAGGLAPGSTLSVTKLLLAFMYPQGDIPGGAYGVPDLVIDELRATLATDADNTPNAYTFVGGMSLSWNFSVFPGSPQFQLSARVALNGERQTSEGQALGDATPRLLTAPRHWERGLTVVPTAALVDDDAPWVISGSVEGAFTLYGLLISAGYQFSPDNSALSFGIWYKARGIQATVTQETDPKTQAKESILTVRLGDLSFGEILEYLISLALPGESRRLSSPWDVLYQINFKNLSLRVNLTTNDIEVRYALNLDLTFAQFTAISLIYKSVNGEGRVYVELTGEFLGQPFGGDDGDPLSWDVINDPAPEVPGKGPSLIDLRYVGMGQHVALSTPIAELDTVEKIITALKASMQPVKGGGNPLTDPAADSLRYDGNANWMFGLDATILDTVTLEAVFFDPTIYGGLIALSGPRAGPLAGLRFELLYRKITNDIGELSVDLRVPDMFRHLEFGEVSITLGTIHLDIYTNGNFRIDLGFPHNQDFSLSFAVEVFPFIGEGGFYFAYLTGATSERVPPITNGEFSPVIEAGLGLAVGLGKDFQAGPLKAGLKVEIFGIFEGVYAPFNPYDRSIGPDTYYWIQGTAGIVGQLYGSVDFVIIKAEVSIVARATVNFVLEAHRPSEIDMKLEVTAKAKVKVLFITIHFSFDLTIEQSFTIGSASTTPWIVGTNSERMAPHAFHADAIRLSRGGGQAPPRLRQQRSMAPIRRLTRLRHARRYFASLVENPDYRSRRWGRLALAQSLQPHLTAVTEQPQAWTPVAVFGDGAYKTARLQFGPFFTVADPASLHAPEGTPEDDAANQMQIVLGFVAENSVAVEANGHAQTRRVTVDHVHALDENGDTPLALMVEAFFRWAAQEGAGKTGVENLSLMALEDLLEELNDLEFQQATFGYGNLTQFLAASLHFDVAAYPTGDAPTETSGTFVPLCPEITASVTIDGVETTRVYTSYNPVSSAYASNLSAYFQQMLNSATGGVAGRPTVTGEPVPDAPVVAGAASLAELIFDEYFILLTQAALQGAVALLQNYPYDYPAAGGPSLSVLADSFDDLIARTTLARGQRLADLAMMTGHHPEQLTAANPAAAAGEDDQVDVPVGVTSLSIAEDNAGALLASGLIIAMPPLPYQVRSGQSLNDIAAAIPFVDPATPLTGAAIGAANGEIDGLLRAGATLRIPAFTYTPLSGDTQHLLTAFFQVRDNGFQGVANLDWYEQAISTMNPNVDWTALTTASPAIVVPRSYLDSTPATANYPIHQGDTLPRIAATFSLFQAMSPDGDQPVTQPTQISAMDHGIRSTDTFDSLVEDFPGLDQAALVAANLTGKVLTPLAVLRLPAFNTKTPAALSIQGLADAYDLSLADLVDIIEGVPALLAANALNIRDVPTQTVNQFVDLLKSTAQINKIATQVSNFLAHGLRVPATDDAAFTSLTPQQVLDGAFTGKLYGMADQVGQQFAWADASQSVDVTLTHSSAPWLNFVDTVVSEGEDHTITGQMRTLNPRLGETGTARAGLILATGTISQIDLTITETDFTAYLPSTVVTLNATAPTALRNYEETPVHYNFQVTQHWQAADRPTLPGAPPSGAPGEPSLWPLPANLQRLAAAGGEAPFALASVPLSAPPGTEGAPVVSYAWGIQIPIAIHRVANPNDPGDTAPSTGGSELGSPWVDGLYLVTGASGDDAQRLYDLWTYLAVSDTGALQLLYTPNAAGVTPKGYASDAVDKLKTVVLKTNLSTTTRDPGQARDLATEADPPTASTYSATIDETSAFLSLLWQASVVVEGGFYLRYDAGGAGLPDFIFDDTGRGSLQVLCLLGSQTDGATGGPLLAVNNVAVVGVNIDAAAVQVYAEQTGAGAPITRTATAPTGSVGFEIARTHPAPPSGTDPTPEQLSGMLYGLIGYKINPATGYLASNEAIPQGPAPPAGDTDGSGDTVIYSQVLNLYPRAAPAGFIAQNSPWLPTATGDIYAGISSTSAASLSFAAHDVFGNQATTSDTLATVSIDNRYTDRLAGIGDWPGTSWSYIPVGVAPDGVLEIDGALQFGSYLPAPQTASETALRSASAHALKFQEAFYQISRPNIGVSVDTSLSPTPLSPPLAPLIGYVSAAYAYTSQLASLPIKTHEIAEGQTLSQVAAAYSVAAEDLLRDNLDRTVKSLFATTITTPVFDQVKHNETLNAFATRVGVPALTLLDQWNNAAITIIPAGTNLAIEPTTGPLAASSTLAEYAAASQCTVGDIARANRATPGLIADALALSVRGVMVTTMPSVTFDALVAAFAGAGVTTTVEEIATANQGVAGLLVPSGSITTYVVDRRRLAAASTIALVTAELFDDLSDFIARNGNLSGLIVQDARLQIGQTTQAPPVDSLRRYLAHVSGVTLTDFALANLASVMTKDSTVLLPALLDATPLAATPYGIAASTTFGQIATLFGVAAQALGTQVQDIPGVFTPGQTVTVPGFGSVVTGPEDSLASLIGLFPSTSQPSLSALADAIAGQTGLMLPGAALVCPIPTAHLAGSGDPLTLTALANAFLPGGDPLKLAKSNAAFAGFLKTGAPFTLSGHAFTVGPWQTLANTLGAVNAVLTTPLTYDALLTALLDQAIVDPAAKVLLPPPGAVLRAALPSTTAVVTTLTALATSLTLKRPDDEIDDNFKLTPDVARATSPIPPRSTGTPATLTEFANAVSALYGGALWTGTSGRGDQGAQRQYATRFAPPVPSSPPNSIRKVTLPAGASFLALPPLANTLVSRPASVRAYASGVEPPFSATSEETMFQAIDVNDWVVDFLATVDLVLSLSYASAAYAITAAPEGGSIAFDQLLAAKASLAAKIAAQLSPIETGDSAIDAAAATEAVRQALSANLSMGFATDAVIQTPTSVQASFAATGLDAGGHRLSGKVSSATLPLSTSTTLRSLAARFTVSLEGVTELLAVTPNLLETGTQLSLNGVDWTIADHDTLRTGIEKFDVTPEAFAAAFADQAPLFRDGSLLTIDGYGASVAFGDTLNLMADALDVSLRFVAVANQDLVGLLTGEVFIGGQSVTITPSTSSLAELAQAQGLTVEVLAMLIADQSVLAPTTVMHIVRWVPEYSLTPGKIDLGVADGALTLLLNVKNRAHYRRLFLNLDFNITALEYAVAAADFVDGYETSKWLHFINPLPRTPTALGGAVIDTRIGQLDIPVPLRAYPSTPRLVNQRAQATYDASDISPDAPIADKIAKAEAWSYYAGFELALAAQDTATIFIGLNYRQNLQTQALLVAPDPFASLAEYAVNAAMIKADLVTLLQPAPGAPGAVTPGKSAVLAMADLATKVAANWGFVQTLPAVDPRDAGDGLTPSEHYGFRLQTRSRSGAGGEPLLDALVLIRTEDTPDWGPAGQIPSLGYLDASGALKPLVKPVVPPGPPPATLSYRFAESVPDSGRLTYVVWYEALNVVTYQNARASLSVSRNQNLTPGRTTNPLFVYQTPQLTFTNLAVPNLRWDQSLLFGSGALDALPTALGTLFTDLLGAPPTAAETQQNLTGRYGYRLVAVGDQNSPLSPDDLVSMTPIFYRPVFAYAAQTPADTADAVTDWFTHHAPHSGNTAFLSFGAQIFSTLMPDRKQPLIDFVRLDFQIVGA